MLFRATGCLFESTLKRRQHPLPPPPPSIIIAGTLIGGEHLLIGMIRANALLVKHVRWT